jgi:hypothetical protein
LARFNMEPHSSVQKWIVSGYFICTIFTTVGFGDIAAETQLQMVFVVLAQWAGTKP